MTTNEQAEDIRPHLDRLHLTLRDFPGGGRLSRFSQEYTSVEIVEHAIAALGAAKEALVSHAARLPDDGKAEGMGLFGRREPAVPWICSGD